MKQRVAVARTLANAPEVMLMDEPFAAVDAQTRMVLQEELVRIVARVAADRALHHAQRRGGDLPGRSRRGDDAGPGPHPHDRRRAVRPGAAHLGGAQRRSARSRALRDRLLELVRGAAAAAATRGRRTPDAAPARHRDRAARRAVLVAVLAASGSIGAQRKLAALDAAAGCARRLSRSRSRFAPERFHQLRLQDAGPPGRGARQRRCT